MRRASLDPAGMRPRASRARRSGLVIILGLVAWTVGAVGVATAQTADAAPTDRRQLAGRRPRPH